MHNGLFCPETLRGVKYRTITIYKKVAHLCMLKLEGTAGADTLPMSILLLKPLDEGSVTQQLKTELESVMAHIHSIILNLIMGDFARLTL